MPGKNIPCSLRDNLLVGECAFLFRQIEWYFFHCCFTIIHHLFGCCVYLVGIKFVRDSYSSLLFFLNFD